MIDIAKFFLVIDQALRAARRAERTARSPKLLFKEKDLSVRINFYRFFADDISA